MIALSPGAQAAQEPFCRPPARETRMQVYQRIRGEFGFRADEAYIRSLIRRGFVLTCGQTLESTTTHTTVELSRPLGDRR